MRWRKSTRWGSTTSSPKAPSAVRSAPLVSRYLRIGRGDQNNPAQVLASTPDFQRILRLTAERGRLLSESDFDTSAHVCVIGALLAQQLFGYRDPIGESIRI